MFRSVGRFRTSLGVGVGKDDWDSGKHFLMFQKGRPDVHRAVSTSPCRDPLILGLEGSS